MLPADNFFQVSFQFSFQSYQIFNFNIFVIQLLPYFTDIFMRTTAEDIKIMLIFNWKDDIFHSLAVY